jgi:predicted transcriptional regulator
MVRTGGPQGLRLAVSEVLEQMAKTGDDLLKRLRKPIVNKEKESETVVVTELLAKNRLCKYAASVEQIALKIQNRRSTLILTASWPFDNEPSEYMRWA